MSTPLQTVQNHLKEAMKAKDKERLGTLRMLLTFIKNEQIETGAELDEKGFLTVVRRLVKQRKDSANQYREAGRDELADKEGREIVLLQDYLPAQVDEAVLRAAIAELIQAEGLEGPKGIGPIMKAMMQKFGATADGGTINKIARELLG